MYEILVQNPVAAIVFMVIAAAVAIILFVKLMKSVGLERIRLYVYDRFIEAEHSFAYGDNEQKYEYVVQLARSAIPSPFNIFITEAALRKTVQIWFDLCKDWLDDGVLNGSGNETKTKTKEE